MADENLSKIKTKEDPGFGNACGTRNQIHQQDGCGHDTTEIYKSRNLFFI